MFNVRTTHTIVVRVNEFFATAHKTICTRSNEMVSMWFMYVWEKGFPLLGGGTEKKKTTKNIKHET